MLDDIVASALSRMDSNGSEKFSFTVTVEIHRPKPSDEDITVQVESTPTTVPDGLTQSQRAIVKAVKDGHHRPSQVEQATGLKHRQVAHLLKELVASGHLVKTRYGRYQAAA